MNFKTTLLSLMAFFVTSLFYAQNKEFSCSSVKIKNKNMKSNTLSIAQIAETEKYDVHFYDLDLKMTNTSTAISGTVEIHGTAREELDSVWLELFQTFTISEIKFNGNSKASLSPMRMSDHDGEAQDDEETPKSAPV